MNNDEFDMLVREACAKVQGEMMREFYSLAHVDGAEMLCDEILKMLREREAA